MSAVKTTKYLSAEEAAQIDRDLMSEQGGYTLEQLMELAGLSCAEVLAKTYPVERYKRVLVITGPGNQGGDGLVAARHLRMFNYEPIVYQVADPKKDLYKQLTKQCSNLNIKIIKTIEEFKECYGRSDVVMDAIFGFSFHPPIRDPYQLLLNHISRNKLPIVSVDIPSGWDVDSGRQDLLDTNGDRVDTFEPQVLLSLTAPKAGVEDYKGRHFVGGRFVPEYIQEQYHMNLPTYQGVDQIAEIL